MKRLNLLPSNGTAIMALLLALFACGFGMMLMGRFPDPATSSEQAERMRIENEALEQKLAIDVATKRMMATFVVIALVAAGALALVLVGGLGFVGLRWLNRRRARFTLIVLGCFH